MYALYETSTTRDAGVIALMKSASSWRVFRQNMDIVYPKFGTPYGLPFGEPNDSED